MSSEINLEYLPLVAEEAAEVIQAIMKIQRFGIEVCHPDTRITNYNNLCYEIGDLLEVINRLGLPEGPVDCGRILKSINLKKYGP